MEQLKATVVGTKIVRYAIVELDTALAGKHFIVSEEGVVNCVEPEEYDKYDLFEEEYLAIRKAGLEQHALYKAGAGE